MKNNLINRIGLTAAAASIAISTAGATRTDANSLMNYLFSEQQTQGTTQNETYANQWFDAFPASLQGAYKVDKTIRTPGAEYTLVHVRQRHYRPESSEADLAKTGEVQDDIYKILSDMLSKRLIRGVYDEGTDPLVAGIMKGFAEVRERLKRDLQVEERGSFDIYGMLLSGHKDIIDRYNLMLKEETDIGIIARIKEEITKIEKNIEDVIKAKQQETEMKARRAEINERMRQDLEKSDKDAERTGGAVAKLHNEGRIEVFAAETYEANLRAQIANDQRMIKLYESVLSGGTPLGDIELPSEVTDMREDVLLDFVFKSKDRTSVTVYGGAHDWTNNVQKWNREHPNSKYSLIVITPEAYKRQEEAKKQ